MLELCRAAQGSAETITGHNGAITISINKNIMGVMKAIP